MWSKAALVVIVGVAATSCSFQSAQFLGDAAPPPLIVGFAQETSLQDEASNNVEVIVRLSRPAPEPIAVNYAFSGGSAQNGPGLDYEGSDGTLSFQVGETERGIPLQIHPDALEEMNETIELTLSAPSSGAELGTAQHVITISAALLPRVNFTLATSSGAESNGMLTLNLSLDTAPLITSTVTIAPKLIASTAVAPYDFTMPNNPVVTFPVGTTSQTINIAMLNDTVDENDEALVIELTTTTNIIVGTTKERTHTIVDNDNPPSVTISATSSGNEGNTGTTAINLTVTLSAGSGKVVTVPFTGGGTATATADYSYLSTADLTFTPNDNPALSEKTKTITINVVGDATDEDNQTVITSLGTPTNATLGGTTNQTHTITDDDDPPTVRFNATPGDATENEGNSGTTMFTYAFELSLASEKSIMFAIAVTGTATPTDDYTMSATTFTINPGATTASVGVIVVGDTVNEPVGGGNETVQMDISGTGLVNVTQDALQQRRIHTIHDDD